MSNKKRVTDKNEGDGESRRVQYYVYDISTLARKRHDPYPKYELYIGGEWIERDNLVDWDTKADRISETDAKDWIGKNSSE